MTRCPAQSLASARKGASVAPSSPSAGGPDSLIRLALQPGKHGRWAERKRAAATLPRGGSQIVMLPSR